MSSKKKVGLALGGGAARGLAHIGVLKVIQKAGIKIDLLAGTSAGAIAAAAFAQETDMEALEEMAMSMTTRDWASLADVRIPHGGFIAGKRIKNLLKVIIGDIDFKDLAIPLSCVACDLYSGDQVVIREGSVLEAARASISIPVIFSVVKREGRYLVDGGLVNQVPVGVVKDMGANTVIAVNVLPMSQPFPYQDKKAKLKEPRILDVMLNVLDIASVLTVLEGLEGADVVINPDTSDFTLADFGEARELIKRGESAGRQALPEIIKAIEV